ncbi:Cupredoxin [Gracilaria domingensis]|nr:Cupredoxin [Gracilaria domingensis]
MIGNEVLQLDVKASRGSGALLAGSFSSALVFPRHKGLNELRCNMNDHVIAGMRALYFVDTKGSVSTSVVVHPEDVDVTHYIAADEIDWDYAPPGRDRAADSAPSPAWLVLYCILSTNINFVGLELLNSTSAGALAVSLGRKVTYLFRVRREAGPSRSDLSAVPYVYYSSVDPISHTAACLTGVIAVTKRGRLRGRSRLPKGTRRAYPLFLQIFRENDSPLIRRSLQKFALNAGNATLTLLEQLAEDEDWLESNAMHSINGYLYGNNPLIRAKAPSVIRFYVFGYGSEASMHSPVWMGQIVHRTVYTGNAANGVQIMPFNAETVDVKAVNRGKWPIICKVADHVVGGMKLGMRVS